MYLWFVVVHLAGLVLFALCHGVSMFVAFRIRGRSAPTCSPQLVSAACC